MIPTTPFEVSSIETAFPPDQSRPNKLRRSVESLREFRILDELSRRLFELEAHNAEHEAHFAELEKRNAELAKRGAELEKRNAELEARNAELEARNAKLVEFTAVAGHDLRAPITTILGLVWLSEQHLLSNDSGGAREALARITEVSLRMTTLLEDLVNLACQGRRIQERAPVEFAEVARAAAEQCGGAADARGVEIVVAGDDAGESPRLLGDRGRLLQVFQNLIDNAVRYMGDQPAPRIEISSRRQNHEVLCTVRDNGLGVDPQHHETIFEPFERLGHGLLSSGLGLALSRRIIEAHGGRLWVDSEGEGRGSSFRFTLPAAPRQPAPDAV